MSQTTEKIDRRFAKKTEIVDGYVIKYHADGRSIWSKGKSKSGLPHGYWEWYRPDGTLKRSGNFKKGVPVGVWITYDSSGKEYKRSVKKNKKEK